LLPLVIFLIMQSTYAAGPNATQIRKFMMVSMAAYGGLGAALNSGSLIQVERVSGWSRQLMISALRPYEFIIGKVVTALVSIVPAIVVVYGAGIALDIEVSTAEFVASLGLLLLGLIPMIILGLAIALVFKPSAVQAATTLILVVLSMLGGLWVPLTFFPRWVQNVGKLLPSYWVGELGRYPLLPDQSFPWVGFAVIIGWAGACIGAAACAYGHAVRASHR
ncbi:MAG: ABC transporter permease, partial [Propionibacteriaceae bacterium]